MAKQINVNLAFTADTSKAKANIETLRADLAKIANTSTPAGLPLNKEMREAVASAKELQRHLSSAMDVKTGNLNLKTLNASLQSSNQSLASLSTGLLGAGANGEKAFMSVQRAVASSNIQLKESTGLLNNLWVSLKNTARWQISSSILHGFMGSIQQAWNYAQNLDKSLNNIRIVTGYSADEMAKFADQANRAAKELSTTTNNYAKASLIYYQQGLSDSEVEARTNTTIKMANVAGESAETVSTQMTAVWNNFDDGSKSLEYYADVMTALGAATASSTAEISEGLQKFASVAETVGLSYEYATSALATITATTRESASVVGTALKTLFARIQGLQLGETLEDGVDLNKYSEALDKIGVSIFEANGEMKTMDSILEETAAKWDTMTKAEQMALAQTVAGVRQYTQFMALMENWDFMQQNLDVAYGSEGTLDAQAEIYAESWEAAQKRVRAASEDLYNDLIPTDFMIKLTDGFAGFINMIDMLVEGMGGLPTILMLISSIVLSKMGPSISQAFDDGIKKATTFGSAVKEKVSGAFNNIASNGIKGTITNMFSDMTTHISKASEKSQELNNNINSIASGAGKDGFINGLGKAVSDMTKLSMSSVQAGLAAENTSQAFKTHQGHLSQILNIQNQIEQSSKYMTQAEQANLAAAQQELSALNEQLYTEERELEVLKQQAQARNQNVSSGLSKRIDYVSDDVVQYESLQRYSENNKTLVEGIARSWGLVGVEVQKAGRNIQITAQNEETIISGHQKSAQQLQAIYEIQARINSLTKDESLDKAKVEQEIRKIIAADSNRKNISGKILANYFKEGESIETIVSNLNRAAGEGERLARSFGHNDTSINNMKNGMNDLVMKEIQAADTGARLKNTMLQVQNQFSDVAQRMSGMGTMLTTGLQGFSTVAMGINAVSNAVKTLNDDTASFGTKLTSFAMAGTMGISALTTAFGGFKSVMTAVNTVQTASVAVQKSYTTIQTLQSKLLKANTVGHKAFLLQKYLELDTDTALSMAKEKITLKTLKEAIATKAAGGAQAFHNAQLLIAIAIIAAVALAIFGLVKAYDALNRSSEEALEQSGKAAQRLKEQAQEAKQEVEGIKDAFDNYQTVLDTLYQCTRGTEEWSDALEDVKAAVNDILEKYPELMGMAGILKFDENTGAYLLDEGMVNDYITQAENKADAIEHASFMGTAKHLEAQAQVELDRFNEANTLSNSATTGRIERISGLGMEDLTDDASINYNLIAEQFEKMYGADWESTYGEIANTMADAAANYNASMNEAGQTVLNASKMMATELLGDENGITDYSQEAIDAASATAADIYEETYDDVAQQLKEQYDKGDRASDIGKHGVDDVLAQYAEITGVEWDKNAIRGTDDGDRRYVIKDGNGGTTDLYEEDIVSVVAAARAAEESTALMQQSADYVQQMLVGAGDELGNFIAALSGGTAGLNQGLRDLLSGFTEETVGSMIDTDYTVDEATGRVSGIDDAILTNLGVDQLGFNQLAESFGITGEELIIALNNLATVMAGEGNGGTGEGGVSAETEAKLAKYNIDTTDMSIDEQNSMGNAIANAQNNTLLSPNSRDGEFNLSALISDNIDSENLDEYLNALGEIDATAPGAAQAIEELNNQYNIQGDVAQKLANSANDNQVFDVSRGSAQYQYDSVQELVGDEPLEQYAQVEAATVDGLADLGLPVDQFFTDMGNGMYELTGNAAEFNRIVQEASLQGYEEALAGYDNALNEASNKYGVSTNLITNTATTNDQAVNNARIEYASSAQGIEWTEEQQAIIDQYNAAETQGEMAEFDPGQWAEIANMTAIAAQEADNLAQAQGRAMAELEGFDPQIFDEYAESLMNAEGSMVETREEANRITQAHLKMERGVKKVTDNWEDWNEALESGSTTEQAEAMEGLADAAMDILGISEDQAKTLLLDPENVDLLHQIAQGGEAAEAAYAQLVDRAGEQALIDIGINIDEGAGQKINDWIGSQEFNNIEIGATLDDSQMTEAFNQLIMDGKATATQLTDVLSTAGYSPSITYKEIELADANLMEQNGYVEVVTDVGPPPVIEQVPIDSLSSMAANGKIKVPVIDGKNTVKVSNPSTAASAGGRGGRGGGGGGGGGGGSSKPAKRIKRTKKSDMVERYKELNDQIERIQKHQEGLNDSMDGLYGKDRQAQVQEYLKALEKEIELIDQKIKKNKEYLAEDTTALQEAAKKLGVTLQFNADGTIANYEEIMTKLWKKQREMEDKQAAMSTQEAQDEYSESTMDPFQEDVDALTEAINDYDETLKEGMDLQKDLMDLIREDIEVMLDDISTTIEETFDLTDSQLDIIDYYAGKMEDSFYGSAESVKSMLDSFELIGAKIDGVTAGLGQLDDVIAKANQLADEYGLNETQRKELVEAQVVEFLMEQQSNLIDNLERINDLDTDMMDAYENALDKMNEELEEYTEHFERLVSLTEHYITLSELIGGDTNYDALMKAYDAQSMVLGNRINSEKATYDFLVGEYNRLKAQYAAAQAAGNEEAASLLKSNMQDVANQLLEAQDNIYSLVAEQAEATRAKIEAQINAQNLTLEKALTGGTSFEYMNTQMEHRVALQEEYLTTTNKIYETTKLMRTAQNAIDETTNSVAKQKLKNFMRETEQLQKQTKLSKYELDIQQAKYDLLLAEIALEEAQDAKSTVRLTRDAEGNFGYVYTADQNQIAEAQQKLEDAQNKLYNLSLEGANDYTQKYQETLEAMYEELAAVNEDFTLTEEERMARMEEIQAHYYEQLMQFSSLYQVALSTDTRVAADAWSTEFNSIMSSTDDYMSHLETYSDNVMGIWKDWGSTLSNLQAWLEEIDLEAIVAESADLSDQITQDGGVIDALEDEMDAVNALVNEYAAMRKEILESVKEVEALMKVVNEMIQTAAGGDMESIREWAASLTGSNYGSSMAIDTSSSSMGRPADFTLSADLYEAILNSIDVNTATLMSAQMLGAIVPASEGQLEQNVYINASFPNANNQYEIEQALVNLANRATQYTNRLTK